MNIGESNYVFQASIFRQLFRIYLVSLFYRKNNLEELFNKNCWNYWLNRSYPIWIPGSKHERWRIQLRIPASIFRKLFRIHVVSLFYRKNNLEELLKKTVEIIGWIGHILHEYQGLSLKMNNIIYECFRRR